MAPITWDVVYMRIDGVTMPVARLVMQALFDTIAPREPPNLDATDDCWLDSGAPLSVIPFHIHHQRLKWQRLNATSTWRGQICDIGRVNIWLPTKLRSHLHGPHQLLAKFARSDPAGERAPVLLGLEFLLNLPGVATLWLPPRRGNIRMA